MMHDIVNFEGYRSILCLNSDLPDAAFLIERNLPIIAADGAANQLINLGFSPQLIIGDLDSVDPGILQQHAFIQLSEQDSNDYQKAMKYLKAHDLLPAIVLGINNGYLDHVLNNINIFMDSNCLLYAPPIKGFVIQKSTIRCILPPETKISLMGIPEAMITTTGLKWDLTQAHLSFPGKTSCFNRTQLPEILLEIEEGSVLVLVYEGIVEDAGVRS